MPTLYMQLRNIGIDKGYKPDEELVISAAETMIEGVNSLYWNNVDMVKSTSNEQEILSFYSFIFYSQIAI